MKEFWASIAAIAIIAIVSAVILGSVDLSAQSVFTTNSVRH